MSKSLNTGIPLFKIKVAEKGVIKDIKEIIARIDGLPSCLNGQIVNLGDGTSGIIMGFDEEDVLVLVLGDTSRLKLGKEVEGVSEPFKIPINEDLIGRMITALGEPCDDGHKIEKPIMTSVFKDSPSIIQRSPITEFLSTGIKIIDTLTPIAKGQRELILGDRVTGKTAIAIDTIINQKGKDVICVYCCIGKSVSALEKAMKILNMNDALDYTIVVVATDNSPVGEQYIVPFSAVAVADFFARKGRDILVVFDDLTKHAWAYRQLSLLLERPPGREAYPGDIFYVQTQLMEQAGKFNRQYGGGSITFMAIAETLQGDMTGYIPSNLVSMCDGQICLSSTIFAEGFRPAVDVNLSLSILGGKTQPPILKELSMDIRANYVKYHELLRLSKLSAGLSDEAAALIKKGKLIELIFMQDENATVSVAQMAIELFSLRNNDFLKIDTSAQEKVIKNIFLYAEEKYPDLISEIDATLNLTDEIRDKLNALYDDYISNLENNETTLSDRDEPLTDNV